MEMTCFSLMFLANVFLAGRTVLVTAVYLRGAKTAIDIIFRRGALGSSGVCCVLCVGLFASRRLPLSPALEPKASFSAHVF